MRRSTPSGRPRAARVTAAAATLAGLLALAPAVARGQCPPASYPVSWSTVSWTPYTSLGVGIQDLRSGPTDDQSYGTPPATAWIDIYNGDNGTMPSLYWGFDATNQVLLFRQRLRGDPRQHATVDDYSQFTWTSNFDIDGDGFSDILVQVNGFNDTVQVLYDGDGDNPENSNEFENSLCSAGGDIVFQIPTGDTNPNNIDPTLVTDDTAAGGGYLLSWQLPLCAFSTCGHASQVLTSETPFSLTFTTSTNEGNPALKDGGFPGDYRTAGDRRLPGSDVCSLDGTCTQRPFATDPSAYCSGVTTTTAVALTAHTLDTLVVDNSPPCSDSDGCVVDTIRNVLFQYKPQGGSGWTTIATVTTPDPGTVNSWSTTWNVSGLTGTQYWVRVTVTDDQGNTNSFDPDDDGDVPGQFLIDLSQMNKDCIIAPLPVSLAWVQADVEGGRTRVRWATVTETGNLGFRLLGQRDGAWRRIGPELVPSRAVDSVEPQHYGIEVDGVFEAVAVEDVDLHGQPRWRGPFAVGRSHGAEPTPEAPNWVRVHREIDRVRAATAHAKHAPAALELLVDRDGIYRVTFEELTAAGLDLSGVPTNAIALTTAGDPVPISLRTPGGEARHSDGFGPGWAIEFYGEALDDLYTSTNVYRLVVDPGLARRIRYAYDPFSGRQPVAEDVYLATTRVEHDREYSFSAPNGDPWYDERLLTYTDAQRFDFEVTVAGLVPGAAPASLQVDLWGWTDFEQQSPDHHVVISFNGVALADELFDGLARHTVTVSLPEGLLSEGANTLTIELPGDTGVDYDLVALDGFEVHYPRRLEAQDGRLRFTSAARALDVRGLGEGPVTAYRLDDRGPVRLTTERAGDAVRLPGSGTEAEYAVSSEDALLAPRLEPVRPAMDITGGRADELVISHALFLDGIKELVATRQAEGLAVRVVDVADVYDQFNHGIFGARGVAEYIRYAARDMGVRYVLLVGGDTYDYHDFLGLGSMSFIPSPYLAAHKEVHFAPVDAAYGDLDGDGVPELAVGRLPVRTTAELDSVVSKILSYEGASYPRTAVFTADVVDGPLSFSEMSDALIESCADGWTFDRAYMDELGKEGARETLKGAINGGVAITSFVGHSSLDRWSFDLLFETADAVALTNHGWPTVVVQWGCWNSYYVSPRVITLGEAFMTSGDQGAAAVLGAASLTDVTSDRDLSMALLPLLTTPGMTIGDAMIEAKRRVATTSPQALDVLLGWTLLGDPAMVIDRP